MSWNSILGLISCTALSLPIIFILVKGLTYYRSFPALLIYYISVFVHTVLSMGYLPVSENILLYWGLTNNFLDAPLMLYFLTYFSTSVLFTRRMHWLIGIILLFESAIIGWQGFTIDAVTIVMAPGLALVFSLCLYFFVRQTKITIVYRKATGKAVIAASLLFAYGCYSIIYLMYYVFSPKDRDPGMVNDVFLIFFVVTIVSSILMSTGIIIEKKRILKLEEVKLARKELATVYKETAVTIPLRTVSLDFEKEQWN
jgi:hypothetical protein